MVKVISFFLFGVFLYFGAGIVGIRYFIDDLVFLGVPEQKTNEENRLVSTVGVNETLIRVYGASDAQRCIIFFPGRNAKHRGAKIYDMKAGARSSSAMP